MDRKVFFSVEDLSDEIMLIYRNKLKESEDVSVYATFEYIAELLENLLKNDDVYVNSLDMMNPNIDSFDGYFMLSLGYDGIWVCKINNLKTEFTYSNPTYAYVHQDCNSKLLKSVECENMYEFAIEEYDSDEDDSDEDDFFNHDCKYKEKCDSDYVLVWKSQCTTPFDVIHVFLY